MTGVDPDTIAEADSLQELYERYEDRDAAPEPRLHERVGTALGLYDRQAVQDHATYRQARQDHREAVRDDIGTQDGLAHETIHQDEATIEVYGIAHGYDELFGVPLYHDISEAVQDELQTTVDELLDQESVIYHEEGLDSRLRTDQATDPDVRDLRDVLHMRDDEDFRQAAPGYIAKELATIPLYKLAGRLPIELDQPALDRAQTSDQARRDPQRQQDLRNLVQAERLPYDISADYHQEHEPGRYAVLHARTGYMADRVQGAIDRGQDRIGVIVGAGHLDHLTELLRDSGPDDV